MNYQYVFTTYTITITVIQNALLLVALTILGVTSLIRLARWVIDILP